MPSTQRASAPRAQGGVTNQDYEDKLREALHRANTDLNQAIAERDRLQHLYEQTTKKLAESTRAVQDLKSQVQAFKDDNLGLRNSVQMLRAEHDSLEFERAALSQSYSELRVMYDNLGRQYGVSNLPMPNLAITGSLPTRSKTSSQTSSGKENRDERGRGRDKEKDRREKKEQKSEKDRLSRRFDEKRTTGGRRNSIVEPRSPGGRSTSTAPTSRNFTSLVTGQLQAPAISQGRGSHHSNVPRTANPMTPAGYSKAVGSRYDDDNTFEDGNYHPFPIA